MKIEKLPSGSYRIRKMYKGKTYTLITEYKPTQKEAIKLLAKEMENERMHTAHMTFRQAALKYIASKDNVLSPRTIKEYTEIPNRLSPVFCDMLISDITQSDIQKEINILAASRKPKTVRNYHGFISAVLGTYRNELKISTTLPQKIKSEPYIPSDEDLKIILANAKGTMYEVPILLACYGLRRSEICALTPNDIDGDIVTINKAMVLNKEKRWIIKVTKTTASSRTIVIPSFIIDLIQKQGYVYKGNPNSITDYLDRIQKKNQIPHFSLHKLRHYFASKMSAFGIPEEDIIKMGGWETDYVMKTVYRHATLTKDVDAQRAASRRLENTLFS